MPCTDGITKDVVSDCSTTRVGGLETTAYVFNRLDVTLTYDGTYPNLIINVANVAPHKCFQIKGVKKMFDSGFDIVQSDDRPDKWSHYFTFQGFEVLAADVLNLDQIDDVIVIVNRKEKTSNGEGTFVCLGAKYGLWKATDVIRENDINGARKIELKSLPGQEEPYSEYTVLVTDYATTLALLEGLD